MIQFNYQHKTHIPQIRHLKEFIESLIKQEGRTPGDLQVTFCSDEFLLDINRTYLQHDYYTDIITFDYSDEPKTISGELYISIDRVKDNAKQFCSTYLQELHRVIFHGVLHLCGYGDKTDKEVKVMRSKEDYYLKKYNTSK